MPTCGTSSPTCPSSPATTSACALHGLPVAFALTGAKADERETLLSLLDAESQLTTECPGQTLIGDKDYFGHEFEQRLAELVSGCCGRPAKVRPRGTEAAQYPGGPGHYREPGLAHVRGPVSARVRDG